VQFFDRVATRLGASHAGLGADAAVFMHLGVLMTLLRAGLAGCGAGFDDSADHRDVRARSTSRDRARSDADVSAVKIEANALVKLLADPVIVAATLVHGFGYMPAFGDQLSDNDIARSALISATTGAMISAC
jgi:hypothetical protein